MSDILKTKGRLNTSFDRDEAFAPSTCHSWGAVAGAGIGLVGGLISGNSAKKAGKTQAKAAEAAANAQLQATRETNDLTANVYKSGLAQNAPYQQGGQLSLSALMNGLGLGGARSSVGVGAPGTNQGTGVGGTGTGGSLLGTYVDAQGRAVDAQGNPIQSDDKYGLGGINYGATQDELDTASGAVPAGYFSHNFDKEDFLNNVDPGYQFRVDQGNAALAAKRASVGNRFGSQALKDISNYNQDLGSQEYGAAFDRYNKNKTDLFNRLSGLAGVGSAAGAAAQSSGTNAANQISNNTMTGAGRASDYLTGGAAASAAGQVGSTNAIVGGINSGLNNWYTGQIINKYLGSTGGGSTYANRPTNDSITLSDGSSFSR